jgi:hypothetical protein
MKISTFVGIFSKVKIIGTNAGILTKKIVGSSDQINTILGNQ